VTSAAQHKRLRRALRQGASLVELLVVMSAATVILTITAALLHRIMLAHSKARAFMDAERTSLRLANTFRSDVHQAISASTAETIAEGDAFLKLELPGGQRLEYRREEGTISRILLDGDRIVSREAFFFPPEIEITSQKDGSRLIALSISSRPAETASADGNSTPPAYFIPINLHVEAALSRNPSLSELPLEKRGAP
jgi:hypothetical protein